jgi:manganese transport protein
LAIVLQTLSARLGLVTGKDLAQQCSNFYPRYVAWFLWFLAELAIAATDLAEVLGTAIGLNLLFGLPMIWGVLLTACDTLLFLVCEQFGHRFMEWFILLLMSIISVCFIVEMFIAKPVFRDVIKGIIPTLPAGSLPVATGILGATIMPHNLYLHSGLILTRKSSDVTLTRRYCKFALLDGLLSLNLALFVNAAILIVASASFYGKREITAIQQAYTMLKSLFGNGASIVFGTALLLAGQSSTITGTLAGQMVMEGFLKFRMRPWLRRMITRAIAIVPAAVVILIFGDYTGSSLLLWSQVVLSIQLPFAIIPLIRITSHKEMGEFQNHWTIQIVGWVCVLLVIGLNIWLIVASVQGFFTSASILLIVFSIIGALLFVAALLFIMFCRIEPKVSRFNNIVAEATINNDATITTVPECIDPSNNNNN